MKKKNDIQKAIGNFLAGGFTQEEAIQFLNHIRENKEEDVLNKEMEEAWASIGQEQRETHAQRDTFEKEVKAILLEDRRSKQSHNNLRVLSIAASLLLLLSVGLASYLYYNKQGEEELNLLTITTAAGETKEILLSDSTKVTLNSCSKITFPEVFAKNERNVRLEGEAFFDVYKNKKKPFRIATDQFTIQVLGTEFNVKTYGNDLLSSVSVQGGKVRVNLPDSSLELIKEEKIEYNRKTAQYVKSRNNEKVAIWRDRSMLFNKTPIKDVANELERMYNVQITLAEGQSFDNLISGEHSKTNLISVLESLKLTSGIKYKYNKTTNEVYLYK